MIFMFVRLFVCFFFCFMLKKHFTCKSMETGIIESVVTLIISVFKARFDL